MYNNLRFSVVSVNFIVKPVIVFLLLIGGLFGVVNGWGGAVASVGLEIDAIAWVSLVWLIFILALSGFSERLYWLLAPFLIVVTPNAVNDFFPAAPMSADIGAPFFSFFTHIDIYLLWGVLIYCDFSRRQSMARLLVPLSLVCVSIFFLFGAVDSGRGWVFAAGSYQLRYVFLFFLLFMFSNPVRYERYFSFSFVVALLLVVFEAAVFTFLRGHERLTSGNYGVNTLGHLMAAGAIFCLNRQAASYFEKICGFIVAAVLVISVILTGTRFSLLAIIIAFFLVVFIRRGRMSWLFLGGVMAVIFVSLFFLFVPLGVSMWEGIALVSQDIHDPLQIQITPESSSMITRLTLWWGTLAMLADHPWVGVAPGGWAFLKAHYGIFYESVLDPHQDFLNYVVSYGWFFGGVFFICIFIIPIFKVYRCMDARKVVLWPWLALVLVFLIAGISNAVTWKHQVSALTYFAALLVCFWCSEYGEDRV